MISGRQLSSCRIKIYHEWGVQDEKYQKDLTLRFCRRQSHPLQSSVTVSNPITLKFRDLKKKIALNDATNTKIYFNLRVEAN